MVHLNCEGSRSVQLAHYLSDPAARGGGFITAFWFSVRYTCFLWLDPPGRFHGNYTRCAYSTLLDGLSSEAKDPN
jgi:hypothetical protein